MPYPRIHISLCAFLGLFFFSFLNNDVVNHFKLWLHGRAQCNLLKRYFPSFFFSFSCCCLGNVKYVLLSEIICYHGHTFPLCAIIKLLEFSFLAWLVAIITEAIFVYSARIWGSTKIREGGNVNPATWTKKNWHLISNNMTFDGNRKRGTSV